MGAASTLAHKIAPGITIGAGVEEAITFTNFPRGVSLTLVLSTPNTDLTYGFKTGETGGDIIPNIPNLIEASKGTALYVSSVGGGELYIRVL